MAIMNRFAPALLLALSGFRVVAQDTDYNFAEQFTTNSNPAGVWSYGYGPGDATGLTLFNANYSRLLWGDNCQYDGFPGYHSGPPCNAAIYFIDGSIALNLGNLGAPALGLSKCCADLAILRFTVPSNGQYRIRIKAWTPWAFEQAQNVRIRANGSLLFSNVFVTDFITFTNSIELSAGQVIDMIGSDHNEFLSSRFNIVYLQGGITLVDTNFVPPDVAFTPRPGLFTNSANVFLVNNTTNGVIRLTLDGTDPTSASPLYSGPILLTNATEIRAALFSNNVAISQVFTAAYARVYAIDDGIPASWREQYFGPGYLTDPRVSADADPDSDLSTNWEEYLAGTNPLDPASGFKATAIAVPMIRFGSVAGRSYRILRRDHVNSLPIVVTAVTATNSLTTYVDTSVTAATGIYMIELLP